MNELPNVPETPEAPAAAPEPVEGKTDGEKQASLLQTMFQPGELVPLKGVWFALEGVTADGQVVLRARGLTGKGSKQLLRSFQAMAAKR